MDNFFNLVGFIISFIVIPLCSGYTIGLLGGVKFTLENINYIFSIIGVFTTVGAVYVAIQVPKKIAVQQDKITLFDSRYQVYDILYNINQIFILYCNGVSMNKYNNFYEEFKKAEGLFINVSSKCESYKESDLLTLEKLLFYQKQLNTNIRKVKFLYPTVIVDIERMQELCDFFGLQHEDRKGYNGRCGEDNIRKLYLALKSYSESIEEQQKLLESYLREMEEVLLISRD